RRVCLQPPCRGQSRGARQAVRQGLCRAHDPPLRPEDHGRGGVPQHEPLDAAAGSAGSYPPARVGGEGFHGAPGRGHAPAHPEDPRADTRSHITQRVDETPDRIIPQGKMDLIEDFAFRLPVTIICDMLGIPEEHREVFYTSSRDGGRLLDPVPLTPDEIKQGNASNAMAAMYFQQMFELRRKTPGDDLIT